MFNSRFALILLVVLLAKSYGQQSDTYFVAEKAFFEQNYPEALKQCNTVGLTDPYYENSLILKGHIYIKLDSLDKSEKSFMDVLKLNPESAMAYNGLGIVYFQQITNRAKFIQLFKKLFVDSNEEKAEKMFLRALDIDPGNLDARYNLARLYIRSKNITKQITAENVLTNLVKQYPENVYYLFSQGEAKKKLSKLDEAEACFKKVISHNPYHSGAALQLAYIKFQHKKNDEFTKYYYSALRNLNDPEIELQIIKDVWDILSDAEQTVVKMGKLNPDFFYSYWFKKDPNPATAVNERLLIHYERLEQARELYAYDSFSGYDDRGKILVKYGDPDDRFLDAVPKSDIKANESWVYKISGKSILFDFVEEGSEYVLVDDLSEAVNFSASGNNGLKYLQDIYDQRAHLDLIYGRISGELNGIITNSPGDGRSVNTVFPILNKFKVNQLRLKNSIPVSKFTYELPGRDLPFEFNYAYFFEEKGKTRLELYFAIDVPQFELPGSETNTNWEIVQNIVIQSNNYDPIIQGENLIKIDKSKFSGSRYITQTNVFTNEADLLCSIQLEDKSSDRKRLISFPIHLPDLNDQDLQLSRIETASQIRRRESADLLLFKKHDLTVIPNPLKQIGKSKPLFIYFEIYNLMIGPKDYAEYEINLKVTDENNYGNLTSLLKKISPFDKNNPESVVTNINRLSAGRSNHEYIGIDLSALNSGSYKLQVTVQDLTSNQLVNRSLKFNLIDR